MAGHRLEQVAARERGARLLHRRLVVAGRVIGKALARRLDVGAVLGLARQAFCGFAVPGEVVSEFDAAAGGAVIGEQAIRHVEHDVALVGLAAALLHEVLDLEHEIVGKCAEQTEQRIVIGGECSDQRAHQRHHAGAAGALVFLDRRLAAQDVAGKPRGALLVDDDAGLAQHVGDEGNQHLAARIQRGQ